LGNAFHNPFRDNGLEYPGGQVVHEKQWRSALHGNIVHAVIDQIAAHGVVHVHHEGDFELGADAVHARDQNRLAELLAVDGEHTAKAADLADHAFSERAMGKILDALLGAVGAVDVHSAVGVGKYGLFQSRIRCWGEVAG